VQRSKGQRAVIPAYNYCTISYSIHFISDCGQPIVKLHWEKALPSLIERLALLVVFVVVV
jgi:hypothetical protein